MLKGEEEEEEGVEREIDFAEILGNSKDESHLDRISNSAINYRSNAL